MTDEQIQRRIWERNCPALLARAEDAEARLRSGRESHEATLKQLRDALTLVRAEVHGYPEPFARRVKEIAQDALTVEKCRCVYPDKCSCGSAFAVPVAPSEAPVHVRAVDSFPNERGCVEWCPACLDAVAPSEDEPGEEGKNWLSVAAGDTSGGVDRVFGSCSEHGNYELPLGSIESGEIERRCPDCAASVCPPSTGEGRT